MASIFQAVFGLLGLIVIVTMAGEEDSRNSTATTAFPVIDLGAWKSNDNTTLEERNALISHVRKACSEIGFFAIVNHGVNQTVVDKAWRETEKFFNLSLDSKLKSKTDNEAEYPYGFEHSERLYLGKNSQLQQNDASSSSGVGTPPPPDLKETFSIGPSNPDSGMPPRRFPEIPEFQSALEGYFTEMESLSDTLLRVFAVALELPEDWFVAKNDRHIQALRLVHYFAVDPEPILRSASGQLRASAHTDYGAFTILKSGGPGLQVKKDIETDEWIDAPHLPDDYIINLGDMMQRWTNDQWVSTLHRVVLPPSASPEHRRQSIAFFVNLNGDTLIEPLPTCIKDDQLPPKYAPVTVKQHLMKKHLASMGIDIDDTSESVDAGTAGTDPTKEEL